MDGAALSRIFSPAAGVWAIAAMVAVALFRSWPLIMQRINEGRRDRADEKASDWERLRIERDRLRELLAKCDHEKGEWMSRAITAEATLQGFGEWRQMQAVREAAKRLSHDNGDGETE